MYVNLYAIIAGLVGTLFIVTKMRHPHIRHVRQSLEGSVLFKVIDALDFYTGNHALFYDEIFPQPTPRDTPSKDPFHSPVPAICSCAQDPSVDHSYLPPGRLPGAGAYQILPALCTTAGVFLFSAGIYLRKSLRLALRENQQNIVIHTIRVERRTSQEVNTVLSASNANVQQDAFVPSPSVSVVTRQDHPIFYSNADPVVVAPPMPVAISDSLLRTNSLPEPTSKSFQSHAIQSDPATPLATNPPTASSITPSSTEAPVLQIDDDLPYLIPLPPGELEPVPAEESSGVSIELPTPIESDVVATSYLAFLPFAQDSDARRSATPTPGSGSGSPRYPLHVASPAPRPICTPQVSCRHPDWLSSAQYLEAHSRLNALVSHTVADVETSLTQIEAPVISPDVPNSPSTSPYKISVPPVRASTSLAQPTTVTGSASHWEHHISTSTAEPPFVIGRTGADLLLAMSTSMPRVIDLGIRPTGGRNNGTRVGGRGESVGVGGISPVVEMNASPRASSILRRVVAAADTAPIRPQVSPRGSNRRTRSTSAMTAVMLQNPWLNRTTRQDGGEGVPTTVSRSTGVSPIQTTVRTSVMRRVPGPYHEDLTGLSVGPSVPAERPPMRITRIFGEPNTA